MSRSVDIDPAPTEYDRRVIEAGAYGPTDGLQGPAADGCSGAIFLCHNSTLTNPIPEHLVCRDPNSSRSVLATAHPLYIGNKPPAEVCLPASDYHSSPIRRLRSNTHLAAFAAAAREIAPRQQPECSPHQWRDLRQFRWPGSRGAFIVYRSLKRLGRWAGCP